MAEPTGRLSRGANTTEELRRELQRLRTAPVLGRTLVDAFPHLYAFDAAGVLQFSEQVVLTADLPAAGAAMNGRIIVEDAGAGDRNLVVYAGGERFRIDGGAAF